LAASAEPRGSVEILRAQPDGLQRETIHVHDLWLPADFAPRNQDGEVVDFRLASLADAARLVAHRDGPEVVTADAALVIVDCLLRHGAIPAGTDEHRALDALRQPRVFAPSAMTA